MKAIVLAGGFGTRLRPLTWEKPKHILEIMGKPLLQYILDYLRKHGITEIFLSISAGDEFDIVEEKFSDKDYVKIIREDERKGGAGAIKYAIEKSGVNETFALVLGDNLTDMNLTEMIKLHKKEKPIVTLGLVRKENPWEYGVAVMEDTKIKKFVEKPKDFPPPSNLVATGIYIMEPEITKYIPEKFLDSTGLLFPLILEKGGKICGYESNCNYWIDVGRRSSYLEALRQKIKGQRFIHNFESADIHEPVWTKGDLTIGPHSQVWSPCELHENVEIGQDCLIDNAIIFSDVKIGNNVKILNSIIDSNTIIEDNCEIRDCIVGKNAKITKGSKVEENVEMNSTV